MKLLFFCIAILLPHLVNAQADGFVPLIGIPGLSGGNYNFNTYVNILYVLTISVAAFLVVVRLILAGFQYMLTDIVPQKEQAKKAIRNALLGLGVILGAVLILNTINPQLTNLNALNIQPVNITIAVPYGEGVPTKTVNEKTGLDTYDIRNGDPTEISKAEAECQPPRQWVVKNDGTASCLGAETTKSQNNTLNTSDNLERLITELGLSAEEAENLRAQYNQFVATQEPENLTSEIIEQIRQYYDADEVLFVVKPPPLPVPHELVGYYGNQVAVCKKLTGGDNIVEDRPNGYIACLRPKSTDRDSQNTKPSHTTPTSSGDSELNKKPVNDENLTHKNTTNQIINNGAIVDTSIMYQVNEPALPEYGIEAGAYHGQSGRIINVVPVGSIDALGESTQVFNFILQLDNGDEIAMPCGLLIPRPNGC